MKPPHIRPLVRQDLPAILDIIAAGRREFGLDAKVQSVLEPADLMMFERYGAPRCAYFIAEFEGTVIGGAGISPLAGADGRSANYNGCISPPPTGAKA